MYPQSRYISVVVPIFNEEAVFGDFVTTIVPILEQSGCRWEIVVVDDGSTDGTADVVAGHAQRDARIKVIHLARNFGKDVALTCGIDYASGDCVIPIDADLQDPPEAILALLAKWGEGYEVVNAVRIDRSSDGWCKRISADLFYRFMARGLRVRITPHVGDFRLLDRKVVAVIRQMREQNRFMKGLFSWPGFRTAEIPVVRRPRHRGASAWTYWKLWNFAVDGIIGYSSAPLKIWFYLGTFVALIALVYTCVIIAQKLIWGNPVAGYPSLMVAILFLGGVQLISLGVIGEYLARVFDEVKRRPLYVIQHTRNIDQDDDAARTHR